MPLPVFDNATYLAILADRRNRDRSLLSQQYDYYGAQKDALSGDVNLNDARRRALQARLGTIGANANVTRAARGVNQAEYGVLGANEQQLQQERGLIGLEQQQAGAQQADVSLIRSARDNVLDKAAVGQAQQAQQVEDERLYNRVGVSAPVSIDVPVGQTGMAMPLGTRPSLRTQEEVVRGQVADREADRQATLQNARLAVRMSATNVTEAELMARRAGLSLADAKLMVDDAQTREQLAGVDVENAQLDNSATDIELKRMGLNLDQNQVTRKVLDADINDLKAPGDEGYELYRDPVTRELSWKTPAEADQAKFDYETQLTRERLPVSLATARMRTEEEQKQAVARNPMVYFDDSDFVWWLAQRNLDPKSRDAYEADPTVAVAEALRQKYPNASQDVINTKLKQYIHSAQVLKAKLQDEAEAAGMSLPSLRSRRPATTTRR